MKVPGLDFGPWLRRLGVRALGEAPELAEVIQPVIVVADHSDLNSRMRTAEAWVQVYQPPASFAAPDHAKAEVRCGGAGTTEVSVWSHCETNLQASAYYCFSFADAAMNMTVAVVDLQANGALARNTVDPRFPIRSRVRRGAGAQDLFGAGAGDEDPIWFTGVYQPGPPAPALASPENAGGVCFYLPPGRFLWLEAYNPDTPIVWTLRIREYPAAESSIL